jgi:hypothetical protein
LTKAGLTYSKKTQSYTLNSKLIGNKLQANTVRVGGGSVSSYSFNAPTDINKSAITYYDDYNNLSFGLKPTFKTATGKYNSGRFVYPINHNEQAVYSVKGNGLREDIILYKNIGNSLILSFKLTIPKTLEARMMPTGDIGLYSTNPILFGNVNANSPTDQQSLQKAQNNGKKDYLEFILAAPTVVSVGNNHVKASLSLNKNQIALNISDLSKASYPLTIDPSVVVASANPFSGGNNDSNTNISATSASTNYITGGYVGAWNNTSPSITTARKGMASVVNNGYIYILGGTNGSTYYNDVQYAPICTGSNTTIGFTTNCSGGSTAGSTGSFNQINSAFTTTRAFASSVVYNGYIYVMGGVNLTNSGACSVGSGSAYYCNDVQYAPICTGSNVVSGCTGASTTGSVGTFTTAGTTLSNNMADFAAVAYNGHLYTIGGKTSGLNLNKIYSSAFNASTSNPATILSSFTDTTKTVYDFVAGVAATAYNNNLYVAGGYNNSSSDLNNVSYYPISTVDGSLSAGISTTPLITLQDNLTITAYSGYLYAWGGWTGGISGTTPISSSYMTYSQINANGSLPNSVSNGYWSVTSTAAPFSSNASTASMIYNGYLYSIGGYTGATYSASVYFAPITSVGNDSNFTTGGTFAQPVYLPAVVIYGGHIFVMGGCFQSSLAKTCNFSTGETGDIYFATFSSSGAIGTWAKSAQVLGSHRGFGQAAIGYRNYLYIFGGCDNTGAKNYAFCTSTYGGYDTMQVNSSATSTTDPLGAVTEKADANAYTSVGASVVASGNYIFLMGGCNPSGLLTLGTLCSISGNDAELTSCKIFQFTAGNSGILATPGTEGGNCTSLYTKLFAATAVAYSGYIYLVGGCPGNGSGDAIANPCGTSGAAYNNIFYISVANLVAGTGTWTPISGASSFTTSRFFNGAYAYNGYMYIYGGCSSWSSANGTCNAIQTDIQYAPIKSDGSLGSFSTSTQSVPGGTKAWGSGNANYNGYIVLTGGCTAAATTAGCDSGKFSASTNIVSLNVGGNSNIGTWTSSTTPYASTSARSYASTVKYSVNGTTYMYMVGGKKASSDTNCIKAGLSASTDCNDILEYTISSTGTVTYQNTYYFVNGRYDAEVAAYNGHLYIIGGQTSGTNSTCKQNIYFGNSATSAVAAGQLTSSLNRYVPVFYYSCDDLQIATINSNGTLSQPNYSIGYSTNSVGYATTMVNTNPYSNVAFGSNDLNTMQLGTHAFAYQGYLYANYSLWSFAYVDGIRSVKINADGSLATTKTGDVYQNYLATCQSYDEWSVTGIRHYCVAYNAGFFGNSDGDLGNQLTLYNGYLYIGKGYSTNKTSSIYWTGSQYPTEYPNLAYDMIENTKLGPNGAIGAITGLYTYTESTWPTNYSLVAYNGYLYQIGGNSDAGGFEGGVGGSSGQFCNPTTTTDSGFTCNTILSAPINYGGGIGSFSNVGTTNTAVNNGQMQNISALVHNGNLIMSNGMGESAGITSFANPDTNISSSPISVIDHSANYSYLINYKGNVSPNETLISASNTDTNQNNTAIGNINMNYSFAQPSTSSCVISPATGTSVLNATSNYYSIFSNTPYPTLAGNDGCSTPHQQTYAQYEYLKLNIDDSGTFTFPDSSAVLGANTTDHTALTNISGYFHSVPGGRLRNGQTFINQAPSSLDASP